MVDAGIGDGKTDCLFISRRYKMLVLSRKAGERICIGDGVELVILESKGGRVRLGFDAPPEVPIHRKEIVLRDHLLGEAVEASS
jgi:carbon storage regulator